MEVREKKSFIRKIARRIMNFLFGEKFPIFNPQGEIEHHRESSMEAWKERYKKETAADWKNHSGMVFKPEGFDRFGEKSNDTGSG